VDTSRLFRIAARVAASDYLKDISALQKRLMAVLQKLEAAVAAGNAAKYEKAMQEYKGVVEAHKAKYPQDKWGYGPGQV
jgi:hypothetical protein